MMEVNEIKDRIRQLELNAMYLTHRLIRKIKTMNPTHAILLNGHVGSLFDSASELRKVLEEPHIIYPGKHALKCRKCGRLRPYNIDFWRVRKLRSRYREKCPCGSIDIEYIEDGPWPWKVVTKEAPECPT